VDNSLRFIPIQGQVAGLAAALNEITFRTASAADHPGQLNAFAALTNVATAGEKGRPGTVVRQIERETSGSTSGRCSSPGSVTEYSGMKANPIPARTIAWTQSSLSEWKRA
jgi:hypothetical protein